MRLITRIGLLTLSLLLAGNAPAQEVTSFDSEGLKHVESLVGLSETEIRRRFGKPDEVGANEHKDAVVWTYIVRTPDEAEAEIAGYRQVAFWNGMVASVSTRWFTDEERATQIYRTSLAYMGEGNRTIARGPGGGTIFTDSLRISRREDNLWMADMLRNELSSHATLLVGDAGYHMCRQAMEMEAKRIEAKFGIDVTQFSDSLRTDGPQFKPFQGMPR